MVAINPAGATAYSGHCEETEAGVAAAACPPYRTLSAYIRPRDSSTVWSTLMH